LKKKDARASDIKNDKFIIEEEYSALKAVVEK